jgi:Lactate racemase N-terminal domain
VTRVPLLSGSRIAVVEIPEDGVLVRPPAPGEAIADVGAAVREALRFPLAGKPLEELVAGASAATLVIEPPSLPIPTAAADPRHDAIAATADELDRLGVARVTILVAGGLNRRTPPQEIGALFSPEFRRRFRGSVIVHDAEADDLVELGRLGNTPLAVNRSLVETGIVVTVTAAETVLHGGPAALLQASGPETLRAAGAASLVETSRSQGWQLAVELERLLAGRLPVTGVSLSLNLPRVVGGYPYAEEAFERVVRSRLRLGLALVPARLRVRMIERVPRELTVAAVFGGTPSAAHTEALIRATAAKAVQLGEPLDAIVIGTPPTTPFLPRERPNPVSAAYLGLGLALRLWRDEFPVRPDGTVILMHDFMRRFQTPTQAPYRALFADGRTARNRDAMREAEQAATADTRSLAEYRAGRAVHPLQPFLEWSACDATANRVGSVLIAGCRDAPAARQLGFVPVHALGAALAMARGAGARRIGFLLSPPYFPLVGKG